jgi:hypothetical protein
LRVAIISTPRSGNTWLLHLLSNLYQAETLTVHTPLEINWEGLPAACILQVHWHPECRFLAQLAQCGFRVVVLARHPLDVLISILQFSLHDPTARWLEGEGGNERPIFGAMPRSTAFLDYATGPRASALLSISREWWTRPDCLTLHYEALVHSTAVELGRLTQGLDRAPVTSIEAAIEATSLPNLRKLTRNNNHFWQGQTNLWQRLFTKSEAAIIAKAQAESFQELGYSCDADPDLTPAQADGNWVNLVWAKLTEDLHQLKVSNQKIEAIAKQLAEREQELEACRTELGRMHLAYNGLETVASNLQEHHSTLLAHYRMLEQGLAPGTLAMAYRVGKLTERHPQAAAFVKRIMKLAG